MFKNWFTPNVAIKIGFEDIKFAIQNPDKYILINTLGINEQNCLIKNTVPVELEERMVNDLLDKFEMTPSLLSMYPLGSLCPSFDQASRRIPPLHGGKSPGTCATGCGPGGSVSTKFSIRLVPKYCAHTLCT